MSKLKEYQVTCTIVGCLPEIPHEDGELNEAMLQSFDSCDFGDLRDVDMTENLWEVEGKYTFTVKTASENVMKIANDVLKGLFEKGQINCGELTSYFIGNEGILTVEEKSPQMTKSERE